MKVHFMKLILVRLAGIILVYIGITSKQNGFYYLLTSGILLGAYYGWYNDIIWRPNGKLEPSMPYRAHQVWIHIICGIAGSIALYLLLGAIDLNNRTLTLGKLGFTEFMLFVIAILGYTGLLPRILWFFTYAQQKFK